MSEFLFAYGTLQAGFAPPEVAPLVAKLRVLGEGCVHGSLYDFGRYPGLVADPSIDGLVYGTICELPRDPKILPALDVYEGYNPAAPDQSLFLRVAQPVVCIAGGTVECWVYIYNRDTGHARLVRGGRYPKAL